MNIGPRARGACFDENEWQLQERALREQRSGIAGGDDPLLAQYRQVARALRQPAAGTPPAGFAREVAAVALASGPPDVRLELMLLRALSGLLGVSAIVAAMLYGGQWLPAFAALLPATASGAAFNWALALGACLALSWSFGRLQLHLRGHADKA